MNNPDEKTAVEQFGKGEKYFGICTLLATLPGLPMFGHGQIEGFTEKYGMEYRRSYWNEEVDVTLLSNHELLIFPLLRNRALYAEIEYFYLFDFQTVEGTTDEDVIAYANGDGNNFSLVVYHNRFKTTSGFLKTSSPFPHAVAEERVMKRRELAEVLSLPNEAGTFLIFRDLYTKMQFLIPCVEIHQHGLPLELNPYHCHVFVDFKIVTDSPLEPYNQLHQRGKSYREVGIALRELVYKSVLDPFDKLVNPEVFNTLIANQTKSLGLDSSFRDTFLDRLEENLAAFLIQVLEALPSASPVKDEKFGLTESLARATRIRIEALLNLPIFINDLMLSLEKSSRGAVDYLVNGPDLSGIRFGTPAFWGTIYGYLIISTIGEISGEENSITTSLDLMETWLLNRKISASLCQAGSDERNSTRCSLIIRLIIHWQNQIRLLKDKETAIKLWVDSSMSNTDAQVYLNVNDFEGKTWFNKESFEEMIWWWYTSTIVMLYINGEISNPMELLSTYEIVQKLNELKVKSEYQVKKLMLLVND